MNINATHIQQGGIVNQTDDSLVALPTMPDDELQQALQRDAQLRLDWDDYYGDRMQKLVFIGQHLDTELIERTLDGCLVSA